MMTMDETLNPLRSVQQRRGPARAPMESSSAAAQAGPLAGAARPIRRMGSRTWPGRVGCCREPANEAMEDFRLEMIFENFEWGELGEPQFP